MLLFESFKNIEDICDEYNITNYTINPDGTIDVEGNVDLRAKKLTKLPLKFGRVIGSFYCDNNQLISLEGSPSHVSGNFICYNNQLTSLKGAPSDVGGFYCHHNQLTSLEGSPSHVDGHFYCSYNRLTSLEGAPDHVGGDFDCYNNQLTSLEGAPSHVDGYFDCRDNNKLTSLEGCPSYVGGYFNCDNNPVYNLYRLFPNHQSFMDSLDHFYLRGTDIIKSRFKQALDEIGLKVPKSIEGYKYI